VCVVCWREVVNRFGQGPTKAEADKALLKQRERYKEKRMNKDS